MNTSDNPSKKASLFLMASLLIFDIFWVFVVGYSLGQTTPGVWDSGTNYTLSFLISALSMYLFPVLGVIGLLVSIRSIKNKQYYLFAGILFIISVILIPGFFILKSPLIKAVYSIAGVYNPMWNDPKISVEYQEKQVKKYETTQEIMHRAHYEFYQNFFIASQKITKSEYYETVFKTENNLLIIPIGSLLVDGNSNAELEFREKQDSVIKEIDGKNVEIRLPPYEVFRVNYNLDVSSIIELDSYDLELYKDPTNLIWINSTHPTIIPVHIYYNGRAIHEELRCDLVSCK